MKGGTKFEPAPTLMPPKLVASRLASTLSNVVLRRGLVLAQVAYLLQLPESEVAELIQRRFADLDTATLIDFIVRLGYDVEIVVRKPREFGEYGNITSNVG